MKRSKYTKAPANTGHLGHFAGCLREGHNTNDMASVDQAQNTKINGDLPPKRPIRDDEKPTAPMLGTVRG